MTTPETKVMPCPHCGAAANEPVWSPERGAWLVACSDLDCCAVQGPPAGSENRAIAAWNVRAPTDLAAHGAASYAAGAAEMRDTLVQEVERQKQFTGENGTAQGGEYLWNDAVDACVQAVNAIPVPSRPDGQTVQQVLAAVLDKNLPQSMGQAVVRMLARECTEALSALPVPERPALAAEVERAVLAERARILADEDLMARTLRARTMERLKASGELGGTRHGPLVSPSGAPSPSADYQMSEQCKSDLAAIRDAIVQPGDPRMNTVIGGPDPSARAASGGGTA